MLEKIKEFFRKLFQTNNQQYLEAPKEEIQDINPMQIHKNSDLKAQIAVNNDEKERALKLQRDFKAGLIEEENLLEEDFEALTKLYENQIEETKESIQRYKNKIIAIKSKLVQNN